VVKLLNRLPSASPDAIQAAAALLDAVEALVALPEYQAMAEEDSAVQHCVPSAKVPLLYLVR
jgi:hypothetical protein